MIVVTIAATFAAFMAIVESTWRFANETTVAGGILIVYGTVWVLAQIWVAIRELSETFDDYLDKVHERAN
jgi:succinate-acetate transporter protein